MKLARNISGYADTRSGCAGVRASSSPRLCMGDLGAAIIWMGVPERDIGYKIGKRHGYFDVAFLDYLRIGLFDSFVQKGVDKSSRTGSV